jgi:hypothetical protein
MDVDAMADPAGLAESLVAPLGRRWSHVQAVAARASTLAHAILPDDQRALVVAAAWWHDIGYAPSLVTSGLHPLDGAVYLRSRGDVPAVVVSLVAYHTGALVEAEERGLSQELAAFPAPPTELLDVVTTADIITGPDGTLMDATDRIAEILTRYEEGTPVYRAVRRSAPDLLATVERVDQRVRSHVPPVR